MGPTPPMVTDLSRVPSFADAQLRFEESNPRELRFR